MAREDPGAPPPILDEMLAEDTPSFDEKLLFIFDVIPVVPLLIANAPPLPGPIITPPQILGIITKPPQKPMPGAEKPGTPVTPYFLGQLPPIKLEGHNITHLSLDMSTHGFKGEIRFRISETKLLGDIKDKDRITKVFRSQNLLMLKLTLRPKFSDQQFPAPLTPVMVPTVIGAIPKPFVTPLPIIPKPTIPVPPIPVVPLPVVPPIEPPVVTISALPAIPGIWTPPVWGIIPGTPATIPGLTVPTIPGMPAPPIPGMPPPPIPGMPPPPVVPSIPPPQVPIRPPVPPGGPPSGSGLPTPADIQNFINSPEFQELLKTGLELGVTALLIAHPELAILLVVAGVAAEAGLLPPELAGPAKIGAGVALRMNPGMAAGMSMIGSGAKAGMLPPSMAPMGAAAGRLASSQNSEVADYEALSKFGAKNGAMPPGSASAPPSSSGNQSTQQMLLFSDLASQTGLLPPGVFEAMQQSPNMALAQPPLSDVMSMLPLVQGFANQLLDSRPPLPAPPLPPAPSAVQLSELATSVMQSFAARGTAAMQPAIPPMLFLKSPGSFTPPSKVPLPSGGKLTLPKPLVPHPPKLKPPKLPTIPKPVILPPNLQPLFAPIPDIVGMPVLYEPGITPPPPLVPIEMTMTAVITEQTVVEHTSYNTPDIIVSIREYTIRFCDPAQALWGRHHPLALYTNTSIKKVIDEQANPLIKVRGGGPELAKIQDMIFLGLNVDNPARKRASFYDWLMWRLDELQ